MYTIKRTSPFLRYGVAVLVAGVVLGIKLLLDPVIPRDVPFLLLFGAVMVSAWYGGLGPGLLTMVLAGLATDYLFLRPQDPFAPGATPLLVFFVEGTLVCLLTEALRTARRRAEASKAEAERDHEHLRRSEEHFRSLVEVKEVTEERLKESEGLYRNVVEQVAENIFLLDPDTGHIIQANASLLHSLGYEAGEIRRLSLYDIVAHDRESVDLNIGRVMEEGRAALGERQYRRKDGSLADVEVNVSAVPYDGERAMCIVAHDVTQRKRAEAMLEEIREAERNRIARELHDGTLQDIVYALQELQVMQVMAGEDGNPSLEDTADALRRSVEGLRGAIFELRLEETLDRSIVASLESLIDLNRRMARERYDIELVVVEGFPTHLSERTGQQITRLVQEALTNVRRHAGAGHVRVELGTDGTLAFVEVSDDGRGFDPRSAGTGIGRQSMGQRARELGGELEVQSAPGEGARIRFSIPISLLTRG